MPVRLEVVLLAIVTNNDGIEHHIKEKETSSWTSLPCGILLTLLGGLTDESGNHGSAL